MSFSVGEHVSKSEYIFIGRSLGTTTKGPSDFASGKTTFKIIKVLKGDLPDNTIVSHPVGSVAGCGINFVLGKKHLIIANMSEWGLYTSLSHRGERFNDEQFLEFFLSGEESLAMTRRCAKIITKSYNDMLFGKGFVLNDSQCIKEKPSYDYAHSRVQASSIFRKTDVYESAKYWLKSSDFWDCRPYNYTVRPLNYVERNDPGLFEKILPDSAQYNGDSLAIYASENIDEIRVGVNAEDRDMVMRLTLEKAAMQGSPIAMRKTGEGYLYCKYGVRQDVMKAEHWLTEASALKDGAAMQILAKMHLAGLTKSRKGKEDAIALLRICASLNHPSCSAYYDLLTGGHSTAKGLP